VGDDDAPDARLGGGVDDREDLVARQVAGGEHEVVAGDGRDHLVRLGYEGAAAVDDRHRRGHDPGLAQLELEAHPDRHLAVRVGREHLVLLVLGADGREPHDPRALARGDLDRHRVQPADGAVQRERADGVDLGHRLAYHARALGGRGVVRLEAEAGQAELGEAPRERDVADAPLHDVGRDVDVNVVRAAHDLARVVARGRVLAGGHAAHARSATSTTSRSLRSCCSSSSG
jgi:hypothetical protein